MSGKPRVYRKLTDIGALRALAHPVRRRLIEDVLDVEQPLTATEAATRCAITPSAMSYHLRSLEKWGMVERVGSSDGRERPWRKTADGFDITSSDDATMTAEEHQSVAQFVKAATRDLISNSADDSLTIFQSSLYLDEREVGELDAAISQLLKDFRDRHSPDDDGVERRRILWINAPNETRTES